MTEDTIIEPNLPNPPNPPITVAQTPAYQPINVDTDGTPMLDGDRCVEVEPGRWRIR